MSSLRGTPSKRLADYEQTLNEAPAISKVLLGYFEKLFTAPDIKPGVPYMADHLIYQQGINQVLRHMRSLNERQEAGIRERYTKGD